MAVATTGLVTDLEAVGETLEDLHHLVDGAHPGATDDLARLAEHAERDALAVDIETDVEHGCLLKPGYVRTAATVFHVTRPTGASFIVSHRRAPRRYLWICGGWIRIHAASPSSLLYD